MPGHYYIWNRRAEAGGGPHAGQHGVEGPAVKKLVCSPPGSAASGGNGGNAKAGSATRWPREGITGGPWTSWTGWLRAECRGALWVKAGAGATTTAEPSRRP
jgi:hypothetical protein